jgi:hypothetical protein
MRPNSTENNSGTSPLIDFTYANPKTLFLSAMKIGCRKIKNKPGDHREALKNRRSNKNDSVRPKRER